jgi:monofunctional biosynthetic peptidoglycan transglycosylase
MTGVSSGPRRAWLWRMPLVVVLVLAGFMLLWRLAPPVSTLMLARWLAGAPVERQWVRLEHISPQLVRAVIASEDSRFCQHWGVDWRSLIEVIDAQGGPSRGASTLTMQTAKNLFLWHGRSYVRKALEIPLAMMLGLVWPRRHVLEVYLNIAEWGDGIFGAEAAARRYFGKSAAALTAAEAALLATALPNPLVRAPARPGRGHKRLAGIIAQRAAQHPEIVSCL